MSLSHAMSSEDQATQADQDQQMAQAVAELKHIHTPPTEAAHHGPSLTLTKAKKRCQALMDFLDASPNAWFATAEVVRLLEEAGFRSYSYGDLVDLKPGTKGFHTKNGSSIIAFVIGQEPATHPWRLFGAHTDSPSLKLKPNAISKTEGIWQVCPEVYGGPILATWFDRPLSLAGRVFVRSTDPFRPQVHLVDFQKPLLILPNLCIHMHREVNEGIPIAKNKDLLPILGTQLLLDPEALAQELEGSGINEGQGQWDLLRLLLAKKLQVPYADILDFDLTCYDPAKACLVGLEEEFISSSQLDNLTSAEAGIRALIEAGAYPESFEGVSLVYLSDNEEIGSRTKQGADSTSLRDYIFSIGLGLGLESREMLDLLAQSFLISCDSAHAVHPNYTEYVDPTHRPGINQGPVIKVAASGAYVSDGLSTSVIKEIAKRAGVPLSYFVNRSDLRGGSTIGPITDAYLPINTVDMGTPLWGMHSIRETGGVLDHYYLSELLATYFIQ